MPGCRPDGTPILSVLAKATFTFAPGEVMLAGRQLPLIEADVSSDAQNPLAGEVLAESDLLAFKPFTDVAVIGSACAPKGRKAYHLDCSVTVGDLRKTVRVYGSRTARRGALGRIILSDPQPFEKQELGYRYAYGGIAKTKDDSFVSYYPNPIGRGFALKGGLRGEAALPPVPHIEDPSSPITGNTMLLSRFDDWKNGPKPASLGWTRRDAFPRYTLAGVLPEFMPAAERSLTETKKTHAQFDGMTIPAMDFRFYQGASEGLWGGPLRGDETVRLEYLDPKHPALEFALPGKRPVLTLDIGDGPRELEPQLHTVVIMVQEKLVTMLWRGSLEYGGIEVIGELERIEARSEE
jgi:hypothetical protein